MRLSLTLTGGILAFGLLLSVQPSSADAVEVIQITEENYDRVVPVGKEVDAIYGDWVLRNEKITAVIAGPAAGRKANMTVRGVAGMLIDFTTRFYGSDQLSCFYPTGGRYLFESEADFQWRVKLGSQTRLVNTGQATGEQVSLTIQGRPLAEDGTLATVTYTLRDDQGWLDYSVEITNVGDQPRTTRIEDSVRCDGDLFETGTLASGGIYAEDRYFGQCYGFLVEGHSLRSEGGRNMQLIAGEGELKSLAPEEGLRWNGHVFCSQGQIGVRGLMKSKQEDTAVEDVVLLLKSPQGPIAHAFVEYWRDGELLGTMQTGTDGFVRTHLPSGKYVAKIAALGHAPREHAFEVDSRPRADTLSFQPASRVRARIVDENGQLIAAKVQFIGLDGTSDPDFGPTSAIFAIKNAVYCARGTFEQPINPGTYRAIISHGPEYDAEFREIEVGSGKLIQLSCVLPRVVDTTGWISAEFHSHSTPSGDNVSHQTGRVLNLLAEHLEFAPCTEHNRIDTYVDDLELLGASDAMATCSGMELTGGPLPINHQNAFPLKMHVHQQDGGGPQTDADPVKQIERLALWDSSSSKVVQSNHPDIASIIGDRDLDGDPDEGFRGMLGWMDVIEVHPPQGIFEAPPRDVAPDKKRENPIFFWMRLMNLGYRIPGVVNTDAHYNFHGSGWLRNYMKSSTDQPKEISVEEMIHAAEHGHLVMSTGPFLQVELLKRDDNQPLRFGVGDDVPAENGELEISIRVQCPNWFDINRVQVFANGRPLESMNYTRRSHPKLFSSKVLRFELRTELPEFEIDTHLIIAAIGEGLVLGPVMGPQAGESPPVAVTNPIFLDIDGGGFQPNGDDLGVPFMLDMDHK